MNKNMKKKKKEKKHQNDEAEGKKNCARCTLNEFKNLAQLKCAASIRLCTVYAFSHRLAVLLLPTREHFQFYQQPICKCIEWCCEKRWKESQFNLIFLPFIWCSTSIFNIYIFYLNTNKHKIKSYSIMMITL